MRYRVIVETESAPDGALRRVSREVQTSEGHSRVEARVVGDALEVDPRARPRANHRSSPARRGVCESEEAARAWLQAVGRGERRRRSATAPGIPSSSKLVDVELRARVVERPATWSGACVHRAARRGSLLRVDRVGRHGVDESMALGSFRAHAPGRAAESEAQARDEVFDHIAPLLQKSPYRIPSRDMNDKIRYRLRKHGGRRARR